MIDFLKQLFCDACIAAGIIFLILMIFSPQDDNTEVDKNHWSNQHPEGFKSMWD